MYRCFAVGLLAVVALVPAFARPERTIVVLDDATDPQTVSHDLIQEYSGRIKHVYSHALKGFSAELSEDALTALAHDPRVVSVEPVQELWLDGQQPNAPWHVDRIDQRFLPLDGLYDWGADGSGVVIFVVDSGLRTTHVEFGGRASIGIDLVGDGQNGQDCNGHGTAVAGAAGGLRVGSAKAALLVAVRTVDCFGGTSTDTLVAAVDWITAQKEADPATPMVANLAVSGPPQPAFELAIQNSLATGVTYIVSAGNLNADACAYTPARMADVLTVGASTMSDQRWNLSNVGSCLDLFAPGHDMLVALNSSDNAVTYASGTSIAAPLVAGVAAMYLEQHPTATPATVMAWLVSLATPNVVVNAGPLSPNRLLFSAVPPATPRIVLARGADGDASVEIHWLPVPEAIVYDIVVGSLGRLSDTAGDFAIATDGCLANDLAGLSWSDSTPVGPDEGLWYLVRAIGNSGPGTYDDPWLGQVQSRDAGIAASGAGCP